MKLSIAIVAVSLALAGGSPIAQSQGGGPPGPGGPGRGIPGATPEQTQAISSMNAALQPLNQAVTVANSDLTAATFSGTKNDAAINASVEKVKAAQLALATKRAEEFAKIQAGPNKLTPDQVTALMNAGRGGGRGAPGAAGPVPGRGPTQ